MRIRPLILSGFGIVVLLTAGILAAAALGGPSSKQAPTGSTTGKVTICHKTHSEKHPSHTISINANAWPAHENHGDSAGACPGTTTQAATTTSTTKHGKSGSAPGHNKNK